jgi:ABC-type transport system involved in multi-copper enzyme maturation permease subunit
MLKALLWKEFRELMPLCIVAPGLELLFIAIGINGWQQRHANDVWMMYPVLYIFAIIIPLVLGYWQNAPEDSYNTFQFLLQRPVSRKYVFGAKLLFGAIVCIAFCIVPLVSFATFAQTVYPDRQANPQSSLWIPVFGIWLLYAGAFLASVRPARRYRSRFFPLFAGIFLFVVLFMFFPLLWPTHPLGFLFILVLALMLAAVIALVAVHVGCTRDY